MKITRFIAAILIAILCVTSFVHSQSKLDEDYRTFRQVKLFKSTRANVEGNLKFVSLKESKSGGFFAASYELRRARLTVYYSTGKCAEHGSPLAYDVVKDIVVGADLFYYEGTSMSRFDFDLSKFRRYHDTEGNSVMYTNEDAGVKLTGGDDLVLSVEFFPTDAEEEKYQCKILK